MKWNIALEPDMGSDDIPNVNIVIIFAHVNPNSKFESLFIDGTKRESLSTFQSCFRATRRAHKRENTIN